MNRLGVLVLCTLAAAPLRAELDRSVLLGLSASVMKVEALRAQGGFSLGSGVVLAPDQVVTNCHVTRDARKVSVLRGGLRWTADAQLSDIEHDLCLLRVPGLPAPPTALAEADRLKPGQPVTALGYTGGMGMQHSEGEVIALHRLDGGRVIRSSNWFNSGASGGGLFDERSQLVGILTFRLRGGEVHYFSAPAGWLRALLEAPAAGGFGEIAPEGSPRLPYWQRAAAEQPRFLRAASMERDERWPELQSLASEWARADAGDAEPWYLMGVALERLGRWPEARRALECSLEIEPDADATRARLAALDGRRPAATGAGTTAAGAASGLAEASARDHRNPTRTAERAPCAVVPEVRTP